MVVAAGLLGGTRLHDIRNHSLSHRGHRICGAPGINPGSGICPSVFHCPEQLASAGIGAPDRTRLDLPGDGDFVLRTFSISHRLRPSVAFDETVSAARERNIYIAEPSGGIVG